MDLIMGIGLAFVTLALLAGLGFEMLDDAVGNRVSEWFDDRRERRQLETERQRLEVEKLRQQTKGEHQF